MTIRKHALLVGINEYLMLSPLKYARRDAEAVRDVLRDLCGFSPAEITLMTCNAPGAQHAVNNCIEAKLKAITDEQVLDLLIFGFWGHGFRPEPHNQYLCAMDTCEAQLERTGLPLGLVQSRLRQAGARDTLVILDCCQNQPVRADGRGGSSGVLEPGMEAVLDAMARDIAASHAPTRVAPTVAVMNACREGQCAYEWDAEQQGIFTWYFLDGLKKGKNSVAALGRYLGEEVPHATRRVCSAEQVPFITIEGLGDIVLIPADQIVETPPARTKTQWYYAEGDRVVGPVSESELLVDINTDTEVWRSGQEGWKAAGKVPEIKGSVSPLRVKKPATPIPPQETQPTLELQSCVPPETVDQDQLVAGQSRVFTDIEFIWCPPGTFLMGSPEDDKRRDPNVGPQHEVTLTQGFWLGKFPVTQAQWGVVMGSNPSYFKGDGRLPVDCVSWVYCQKFIKKLNSRGTGTFHLPTEAEWEYACRAGSTTAYYFGDSESELDDYAWFLRNSGGKPHPVGEKKPNTWGLYDMYGNVWEWCQDWYGDYPADAVTDPTGPTSGSYRVNRGGSWNYSPRSCRSALRDWDTPGNRFNYLGFRLALSPVQ